MLEAGHKNGTYPTEMVVPLFQIDPSTPAQFLETLTRKDSLEPEKRLMLAVLEDGVHCFKKYLFARDRKGRALFREIEEWMLDEESDWIFSFNNICESLELDPQYVRRGLMRWKEKEIGKQATTRDVRPVIHHLHS